MGNVTEQFLKSRNNVITLTLTEDGAAISGSWTDLDIDIIDIKSQAVALNISRTSDGDGVALNTSTGVLTINEGLLTEDASVLKNNKLYRAVVTVKSSTNAQGAVFGGEDSTDKLYFYVSAPP